MRQISLNANHDEMTVVETVVLHLCYCNTQDCVKQLSSHGSIWCDTRVNASMEVLPCEDDEE